MTPAVAHSHEYFIGSGYVKKISELSGSRLLVFDTGPLISLTVNNLLSTLEKLKERYSGKFVIPESVKDELVDQPLRTKKFMFEAMQVQRLISTGVLEVVEDSDTKELTLELLRLANSSFAAKGRAVQVVQYGEMASIAAAKLLDAEALVMDERITRELVEHPKHLADLMERRLHTTVTINSQDVSLLQQYVSKTKIIRSVELASVAFELGLLDRYVAAGEEQAIPKVRQKLLESVLWGLKMNGCAVSGKEIEQIIEDFE
ncbi:hypothetical protein HYU40_03595 [Candidatus Woesearchaeota archaeon]|nr:hypothetical protein [Candidatus Woesearchaeota archaeon]